MGRWPSGWVCGAVDTAVGGWAAGDGAACSGTAGRAITAGVANCGVGAVWTGAGGGTTLGMIGRTRPAVSPGGGRPGRDTSALPWASTITPRSAGISGRGAYWGGATRMRAVAGFTGGGALRLGAGPAVVAGSARASSHGAVPAGSAGSSVGTSTGAGSPAVSIGLSRGV